MNSTAKTRRTRREARAVGSATWSCFVLAALVVAIVLAAASSAHAQGSTTRYIYDDNGRLRAVIAPSGEANVYEYDAAGNITAIRRNTAGTLEVLDFSPKEGVPGTQVRITGTGFGGGVNAVAFNGTAARIISVNAPVVVVTVPSGVTTGPITVTTLQGTATTAQPFVVKGLQLTPPSASLNTSQSVQFTAVLFPLGGDQSVLWSVNGVEGGNAAIGTITATGLYTAPMIPFPPAVVRATSVADPSLLEDALVTYFNAPPRATPIASVSVQRAASTGTTVALQAANIPLGTVVQVTLLAATGTFTTVQSTPLDRPAQPDDYLYIRHLESSRFDHRQARHRRQADHS